MSEKRTMLALNLHNLRVTCDACIELACNLQVTLEHMQHLCTYYLVAELYYKYKISKQSCETEKLMSKPILDEVKVVSSLMCRSYQIVEDRQEASFFS